jgi:hypothetical protein
MWDWTPESVVMLQDTSKCPKPQDKGRLRVLTPVVGRARLGYFFSLMTTPFTFFARPFAARAWWRYGRVAEEVAGV